MIRLFVKYSVSLSIFLVIGVFLFDYIILPLYVGTNNEHFLPDVRGLYTDSASYELNSFGFNIEIITAEYLEANKPGTVIRMSPRAFTKAKEGRTIQLTIAGHKKDLVIPDYVNKSLRNAKLDMRSSGLNIDTLIYEFSDLIAEDYITFQLQRKGHLVKTGAKITLGVSKGNPPDYYTVPNLLNLSLNKAKSKLILAGLRVGDIEYEFQPELLNNTVIEQSMTVDMKVSFPASINLIISTDKETK